MNSTVIVKSSKNFLRRNTHAAALPQLRQMYIMVLDIGGGNYITKPFKLSVLISCAVSIHAPAKRIRSMAITETINEL